MTRYTISAEAEADLEDIGDYIAQDNPERAETFIEEIRARCEAICQGPSAYAARPEVDADVRVCIHGRYVIFFYIDGDAVRIARILHSARDINRLFRD